MTDTFPGSGAPPSGTRRLAASPTFKCAASSCETWARAITWDRSMIVMTGPPLDAISPAYSGRSVTTPAMGLVIRE